MEAPDKIPDKIYLNISPFSGYPLNKWYKERQNNKGIEYTRTDVIVEKAWEWVEDNILSINQQDKSRLYFEQFKNYMKGE